MESPFSRHFFRTAVRRTPIARRRLLVCFSPPLLLSPSRHAPRTKTSDASVGRILKYTGLFGGVQGFYALMAMVRNKNHGFAAQNGRHGAD